MNDDGARTMNESDEEDSEFRKLTFAPSRLPALDGLVTFVPAGQESEPVVAEAVNRKGWSRWYDVEGGHRLVVLYEGQPYDAERFRIEKGVWDHEHCKRCSARIPSMTLCWVSTEGYVILCSDCHQQLFKSSGAEQEVAKKPDLPWHDMSAIVDGVRQWWRWRLRRSQTHIYGIAEDRRCGTVVRLENGYWTIEDEDGRDVRVAADHPSAAGLHVGDRVEVEPIIKSLTNRMWMVRRKSDSA